CSRLFAAHIKARRTLKPQTQLTPIFIVRVVVLRDAVVFPKRFRQRTVYGSPRSGTLIGFACHMQRNSPKETRQFFVANKTGPVDLDICKDLRRLGAVLIARVNFEPAELCLIVINLEASPGYRAIRRIDVKTDISVGKILQTKAAFRVTICEPPVHHVGKILEVGKEKSVDIVS